MATLMADGHSANAISLLLVENGAAPLLWINRLWSGCCCPRGPVPGSPRSSWKDLLQGIDSSTRGIYRAHLAGTVYALT